MAGITAMGVGSGLDLEELITGIVSAERTPAKNRLDQQEAQTTATISALGSLKASLADFQSALGKLVEGDPFYARDRKSTRLNSSNVSISYAVLYLYNNNYITELCIYIRLNTLQYSLF